MGRKRIPPEPVPEEDSFFDDPESDPTQENEEDLQAPEPQEVRDVIVAATDWTTETLLNQLHRGNIDLNPRFQRRDAWTAPRKSLFIESILLGLPIPQLVLAERPDQRGAYLVIDGKQRLLTLLQFAADEDSDFAPLKLTGLEIRKDINGSSLTDLRTDNRQEDVTAFENQTIRTVVVKNWRDDNFLYRVFLRLNTNSVPLSPQELRQALHPGPFVDFLDEYSSTSEYLHRVLAISSPDFRMRDVELLLRYFAFTYFLPEYRGNLKVFLDDACDNLNSSWDDSKDDFAKDAADCDAAISTTYDIFGEHAFRRWSGERYEGRFNRAVFDAMVFYFDRDEVASRARESAAKVKQAFEDLCVNDEAFDLSLRTTTKTIQAVEHRLQAWGETLIGVLKHKFDVPQLVDGTIRY